MEAEAVGHHKRLCDPIVPVREKLALETRQQALSLPIALVQYRSSWTKHPARALGDDGQTILVS